MSEFAPLVVLDRPAVADAAGDTPLGACLRRLLDQVADDEGVISAFGSFIAEPCAPRAAA